MDVISADCPKKKRLKILFDAFAPYNRASRKQIIISSYQLVSNMVQDFSDAGVFDYVVLDEGHIIKNANTKTSKSMHTLRSHHRLLLSGKIFVYCYYSKLLSALVIEMTFIIDSLPSYRHSTSEQSRRVVRPTGLGDYRTAARPTPSLCDSVCDPDSGRAKPTGHGGG